MNAKEENIQELAYLLKELGSQIDMLANKKNAAELTAKQYAKEIADLQAKQREVTHKIRELEATTCNMWENIGDGG